MTRLACRSVLWFNRKAKALAIRLVVWTRKARAPIHPKHLLPDGGQHWYLRYLRANDVVLDIGCGTGTHTLRAASRCRRVDAYDRDPVLERDLWLRVIESGVRNVSLTTAHRSPRFLGVRGVYDVVLCLDVLEHVTEDGRRALLRDIGGVLSENGCLLLLVPNRDTAWKRRLRQVGLDSRSDADHKVEYTMPELEAELHAAGFSVVRRESCVADTPWIGFIDLIGGLSLTAYGWLTRRRHDRAVRLPQEDAGLAVVCQRSEDVGMGLPVGQKCTWRTVGVHST